MLQDILQRNGFAADVSLNPQQGLKLLESNHYELVVTDYKMPEMDGSQFLLEARKINPELPVIMISGLMNMPELIKVANIGVTLVLEKPFDTDDFLQQVRRFVDPATEQEGASGSATRESSEVHYTAETGHSGASFEYPLPVRHLSDRSADNRRLLDTLWRNFGSSRHLVFYAAKGSEIRLVAREVLGWMQEDPDQPVVLMDLLDTKSKFTRNWLQEEQTFPSLLLIDLRGMGWTDESRDVLRDWVAYIDSFGDSVKQARMLYTLPTDCQFDIGQLQLPRHVAELFGADCPLLLSLRDRVVDCAWYLRQMLTEEILSDSVVAECLLQYPWPGGYAELTEKAGNLQERANAGEQLSAALVREVLTGGDPRYALPGRPTLESWLLRRQNEYLSLQREGSETTKETLLRIGVDVQELELDSNGCVNRLLYPELLAD
jgi:CheY-like chemotaxis protein